MFRTVSWLGVGLVVALGVGCETDEPRTVALDEAEQVLGGALCERVSRCQCDQWSTYDTVAECEADVAQAVERLQQLEATLTYDAECMGGYVDQLDSLGCSPVLEEPTTCVRPCLLMYGEALQGEPCELYGSWVSDCAQGLVCQGSCVDPCADESLPLAGEGQECFDRACADDLFCNFETGVCEPLPRAGEECPQGRCQGGAFCEAQDPLDPMSPRLCSAPRAMGEPCRGHMQCDSGYCPAGACARLPTEGESCAGTNTCAPGLDCVEEVCVPGDALLCTVGVPNF